MPFPVYDEAFRRFLAFDLNHSVGAQKAVMRNQALPMHGERGHFPAIGFQPVAVIGRIHDCGTPIGRVEHARIISDPELSGPSVGEGVRAGCMDALWIVGFWAALAQRHAKTLPCRGAVVGARRRT